MWTDFAVGIFGLLFGSLRGSSGIVGRTASAAVACAAINTATKFTRDRARKRLKDRAARQEEMGVANKTEPSFVIRNSKIHMIEKKGARTKSLPIKAVPESPVLQIGKIIQNRTQATYSTLTSSLSSSLPVLIESNRLNIRKQIAA